VNITFEKIKAPAGLEPVSSNVARDVADADNGAIPSRTTVLQVCISGHAVRYCENLPVGERYPIDVISRGQNALQMMDILHLTTKITDRCRKRALAANPAPVQSATHGTAARGSGSVHLLVR